MANYIFSDIPLPSSTSIDTIRLGASSKKYITDILHVKWTDDETYSEVPESISNVNDFLGLLKYGIEQMNELIDSQTTGYKFLDILWSDGTVTQTVRPTTDDVKPIGLCVAPTGFFGPNERARGARFMALKYVGVTSASSGGVSTADPTPNSTPCPWTLESAINDVPELYNYPLTSTPSIEGLLLASYEDSNSAKPHIYTLNETWMGLEPNPDKFGRYYALGDINGKQNTDDVSALGSLSVSNYLVFKSVLDYYTDGTQAGDWYLPAAGELAIICANQSRINPVLARINTLYNSDCMSSIDSNTYWSSTEYIDTNDAVYINFSNDYISHGPKNDSNLAIPMLTIDPTVAPTPTPTPIPLTD